nr:aspartate/glutamate racemase family protein [Mesorhizobium sp.]
MIDDGIRPQLGIIGGLGPLASADFYFKLTRMTEALRDNEHVPSVLLSVPQLPDRTEAILAGHDGPLAPLRAAIATLNELGVACIAMPATPPIIGTTSWRRTRGPRSSTSAMR